MGFKGNIKCAFYIVTCLFLLSAADAVAQTFKLKVTVDGARVNATATIEGTTMARLSLDTLLVATSKQGEWYPVSLIHEGVEIKGFIHEMLVSVITEEEWELVEVGLSEGVEKTQEEIIHEIESGIEAGRELIRQKRDLELALHTLRPLVAKVFRVSDLRKQRHLAVEIFLWMGLGYAAQNDLGTCMMELENMYEADRLYAREITRNIIDPEIIVLIRHVEKRSRGEKPEYVLHLSTRPADAVIMINGEEKGTLPGDFVMDSPIAELEIILSRYETIKDNLLLTDDRTEKSYDLKVLGRDIALRSTPTDAQIFLDEKETGERTNCILPLVPFGKHHIRIGKENFLIWETSFELEDGLGPHYIDAELLAKNYEYQMKWGGPYDKMFKVPVAIALDKNQYFYVLDNSDAKVKRFSPQGDLIRDWMLLGNEKSGIRTPSGIAVDSQGFVYIADSRRHCIWKFYPEGNLSRKWGREGSGKTELNGPEGIAFDSQDNLFVIDNGNMRVIKFTSLGVVQAIWDNPSNNVPMTGIAVNSRDEIFILDEYLVQKFSSEGERLDTWGEAGTSEGQFHNPRGIYVDKDQFVYITDTGNKRIQKYDETGNFLTQWGPPEMSFPLDVVVNSEGKVLVVDRDANRLVVYRIPPEILD